MLSKSPRRILFNLLRDQDAAAGAALFYCQAWTAWYSTMLFNSPKGFSSAR